MKGIFWMLLLVVVVTVLGWPAQALAAYPIEAGAQGPINGWLGEYYADRTPYGTPAVVRDDAEVNFNWGYGSPAGGLPSDGFSARWTRSVYFTAGTYRFFALSDDGVRIWLDGELLIDQWHAAPGVTYTEDRTLAGGIHLIRIEYFEESGGAKIQFWWEVYDAGYYPHWKGTYYANASLDGHPILVRNDEEIAFNWHDDAPIAGMAADRFSVRWTRSVRLETAVYRFHVTLHGDAVLWVGDELVLSARGNGSNRDFSVDYYATRGDCQLKLEYFKTNGDARVELDWELLEEASYPDWKAEYFANRFLLGQPLLVRNDEVPVFDWGEGAPFAEMPRNAFSVRWTRTKSFEAGTYEFYARVDDGIRVYVDGALVLDEWEFGQGVREYTAEAYIEAGEHEVVVEYFDRRGEATITFWWVRMGS
jgi:hypothetical protein